MTRFGFNPKFLWTAILIKQLAAEFRGNDRVPACQQHGQWTMIKVGGFERLEGVRVMKPFRGAPSVAVEQEDGSARRTVSRKAIPADALAT